MEKVYVLMETTNDAGWFLDKIVCIFKTADEANKVKDVLKTKMEEMGGYEDTWLDVSEYSIGIIYPIHVWYDECGFKRKYWK